MIFKRGEWYPLVFILALILLRLFFTYVAYQTFQDVPLVDFLNLTTDSGDLTQEDTALMAFVSILALVIVFALLPLRLKSRTIGDEQGNFYNDTEDLPEGDPVSESVVILPTQAEQYVSIKKAFYEELVARQFTDDRYEAEKAAPEDNEGLIIVERGAATAAVDINSLEDSLYVSLRVMLQTEISRFRYAIYLGLVLMMTIPAIYPILVNDFAYKWVYLLNSLAEQALFWAAIMTLFGVLFRNGDAFALLRAPIDYADREDASILRVWVWESLCSAAASVKIDLEKASK
jgi:hypothetical protein